MGYVYLPSQSAALTSTPASCGIGVTLTSQYSGRFLVMWNGHCTNNAVAPCSVDFRMYRISGSLAINNFGSAQIGSGFANSEEHTTVITTSGQLEPFCVVIVDSPGSGTWTWVPQIFTDNNGTVTCQGVLNVVEL